MSRALLPPLCIALLTAAANLGAQEWFISPGGNDANAGTSEAAPFQSLYKADSRLSPGDTITVLDGTYPVGAISKSGTASAWITLRAKNRRVPLFSLAASAAQNPGNAGVVEWNCLGLANVAYVKVIGLSVQGWNPNHSVVSSGHGICIQGCHHIVVQDCRATDCSGNGITGSPEWWNGPTLVNGPLDFITFEGNEVGGCAFWNQYQCHGISLWKSHAAGLGADPSGFNCVIRRNIVHGNENKIGTWGGAVATATDGNGIILDSNNDNGYPYATLVEGNLVYDNGGRGIDALKSNNATLRFNTCWHNNRNDLDGTWKQGELTNDNSANFHASDNIAVANGNAWSTALSMHSLGGAVPGAVLARNLLVGPREVDGLVQLAESGTLTADPKLVNPTTNPALADFRLQAGSPALDAADAAPAPSPDLAGTTRPQGAANDLGAYERPATVVNHPPVAAAQSVTTTAGTAKPIILTATDADGDPLTYAIIANPAHGTLSGSAASRTYTPTAGHTGADSFTFKANDGTADSNTATVSITVSATTSQVPDSGSGGGGGNGCGASSALALFTGMGLMLAQRRRR